MPANQSWHIALADIALILFLLTATALARQEELATETDRPQHPRFAAAGASAIFDSRSQTADFTAWLDQNHTDSRQQLTLYAEYRDTDEAAQMLQRAQSMIRTAQQRAIAARLVLENGERPALRAVLAFDGDAQMARSLLQGQEDPTNGEP